MTTYIRSLLLLSLFITLTSCGGGSNGAQNNSNLSLDGSWWIVGYYSDGDSENCGDRGPWNAHLDIVQNDLEIEYTSNDMDGGPYHEVIQLDENYSNTSTTTMIDGNVTETHTRTSRFISSSALVGTTTVTRDDGVNRCQTVNNSTAIKLESPHLNNLAESYCMIAKVISSDVKSLEQYDSALQLKPTNQPNQIDFTTSGGSIQFSGSGSILDDKVHLIGTAANGMTASFVLSFARQSDEMNGTLKIDWNEADSFDLIGSISGYQGSCWTQSIPQNAPTNMSLPMSPLENIIDFQVYDGVNHDGIDFKPNQTLLPVYAPVSGLVTSISSDYPQNGNLIHGVRINYNEDYYVAINFEPYTGDPLVAEEQKNNITASLLQHVNQGDVIGYLVVPGNTEFPHIHWGVGKSSTATTECPSDFLSITERITFESYVASLEGQGSCP